MNKQYHTPFGTFEWDETKAKSNLKKHGISFETAAEAFTDLYGIFINDVLHNDYEERFQLLAMLDNAVITLTIFTGHDNIRIISARKATKQERKRYEKHRQQAQ